MQLCGPRTAHARAGGGALGHARTDSNCRRPHAKRTLKNLTPRNAALVAHRAQLEHGFPGRQESMTPKGDVAVNCKPLRSLWRARRCSVAAW
jgi:hypothetical protein